MFGHKLGSFWLGISHGAWCSFHRPLFHQYRELNTKLDCWWQLLAVVQDCGSLSSQRSTHETNSNICFLLFFSACATVSFVDVEIRFGFRVLGGNHDYVFVSQFIADTHILVDRLENVLLEKSTFTKCSHQLRHNNMSDMGSSPEWIGAHK